MLKHKQTLKMEEVNPFFSNFLAIFVSKFNMHLINYQAHSVDVSNKWVVSFAMLGRLMS